MKREQQEINTNKFINNSFLAWASARLGWDFSPLFMSYVYTSWINFNLYNIYYNYRMFFSKPPSLRRGTHAYCSNCYTCCQTYSQIWCDNCKIRFDSGENIVYSPQPIINVDHHLIGYPLYYLNKMRYLLYSRFYNFKVFLYKKIRRVRRV